MATAAFIAALALGAGAMFGSDAGRADDHTVVIENMRFEPAAITVDAGDHIIFVNRDFVPHTATAGDGAFDSSALQAGQEWTYTAAKSGAHAYACTFHPTMTGTVTVR